MHYSRTLPGQYHKPEQISNYLAENAATVLHFIFSFIMLRTLKRIELGDRLNEEAQPTSKALLLPLSLHAWTIMTPSIVSAIESHHLLCHSQLHPESNTLVIPYNSGARPFFGNVASFTEGTVNLFHARRAKAFRFTLKSRLSKSW
jgi:hypothetical protein